MQTHIRKSKKFEEGKLGENDHYIHIEEADKDKLGLSEDLYIAHFNEKNAFDYIGLATKNEVARHSLGIEFYKSKDIFVGGHVNDARHGMGLYIFNSYNVDNENPKSDSINRFYYGGWKDNRKHGTGALINTKQYKENTLFEGYEGLFYEDGYDVGVYYEESLDKSYCAYYGLFDDFKKHDKEGLFYVFYDTETSVILGNIDKDVFKEGVKFNFDDNGSFLNYIVFTMNEAQTEHEHKDQGESETVMNEDIKAKFAKAKTFFAIVNAERKKLADNYRHLAGKEQGLLLIKSFDEFYRQHNDLKKELGEYKLSNFGKRLLTELKKPGKGDKAN